MAERPLAGGYPTRRQAGRLEVRRRRQPGVPYRRGVSQGAGPGRTRRGAVPARLPAGREADRAGFEFAYTKANTEFVDNFKILIEQTSDGNTVSAVAHKIRANDGLVKMVLKAGSDERLDVLFEKTLECTGTPYFDAVKAIMPTIKSKTLLRNLFQEVVGIV